MMQIRPIDEELNRVVTIIEVEDDIDVCFLFLFVYNSPALQMILTLRCS
jgi:hypothetical protein